MPETISNIAYQNWLLNVLEHPGSDEEAWNSAAVTRHIPFNAAVANVLPSATLGPLERVAIYRRMFFLRMTDAMEIDYPGVLFALGRAQFRHLIAHEYIPKHPSTSYTLNHLGRHFPAFLAESGMEYAGFLSGLAKLELAITDLMDMPEPAPGPPVSVENIPADSWESVNIRFVPAVALLSFSFPVDAYLREVQNEQEPAIPAIPKASWVLVYRQDFDVNFISISKDEFDLLTGLMNGLSIGNAIASLQTTTVSTMENLGRSLTDWFQRWMEIGIVHRLEVTAQS